MKKDSIKNIKINNEVLKELSIIITTKIKDPRVSSRVSVVEVYVTTDLKLCKAYISVNGSDKEKSDTLNGLKSAQGFIRKELASSLNLRNTPTLEFILDNSMDYAQYIEDLINKIHENE